MPENTSYNVDSGNESEQITRLFEVGVIVLKFDPIANTPFEKRPSGYFSHGQVASSTYRYALVVGSHRPNRYQSACPYPG